MSEAVILIQRYLAPPAEAANAVASPAPKPSNPAGADDKPNEPSKNATNGTEPSDVGTSPSSESKPRMLEHVLLPKTLSDSEDNEPKEPPKNVAKGKGCFDDGASHTAKPQDDKSPVPEDAVPPTTASNSADAGNEPPKNATNGTARIDVRTSRPSKMQVEGSPMLGDVVLPSPRGPEKLLNNLGVPLSVLDRMIETYPIVRGLHGENKRQSRVLRLEQCARGHRQWRQCIRCNGTAEPFPSVPRCGSDHTPFCCSCCYPFPRDRTVGAN